MNSIAPWKSALILLVCVWGILYSLPNLFNPDTRAWVQSSLPGWLPHKTVNLGLDLRGGAHLLYEVDVASVVKDRTESLLNDTRAELRQKRISYSRIGVIPNGVRVTLSNSSDVSAARRVLRDVGTDVDISTGSDGVTVEAVMSSAGIQRIYEQTISQSIEVVRRRIDELGTTEPIIQRQGDDRILIQAPGAGADDLKALVGETAMLNFHLVREPGASTGARTYPFADDPGQSLSLDRRAIISGDMLANAQPAFDQSGQPVISFRLNNAGARRFCDVSRNNVNKPFAIVLDDKILSAPVIREPLCGGQAQISGGFTLEEANNLALLLRAGALPADMHVIEERTVGPSLGADSIEAGKKACIVAMIMILIFMVVAYGTFGIMANVALILNMAMLMALLSSLQATLTLPGIAGIVLTMGMAVDANVLIFERTREEVASGRSALAAIDAGYKNAMSTIIDSNLTSVIVALILFSYGTGPVKGFAVTMGLGLVTSFFSAVMVTRLMVLYWVRWRKPTQIEI